MNTNPLPLCWLLLALVCVIVFALPTFAAEPLQGNFIMDLVANRSRLIQVSIVAVIFSCSLLWWKR